MDFIKINGIFDSAFGLEKYKFYIDYKNSRLYVPKNAHITECPVRSNAESIEIEDNMCRAFDFDKKMISYDFNAKTTFMAADYEKYYENEYIEKRQYMKDLLSGLEIGKPLVFFIKYNDPTIKEMTRVDTVAIAEKGFIGTVNVQLCKPEYKTTVAHAKETVLLRCKEVCSVEFISEIVKAEEITANKTLGEIIEPYRSVLNSNKSDRLKLEDIRKETIKAIVLNKDKYIQHTDYGMKLKTNSRDNKKYIEMLKKESAKLDTTYMEKKNASLGKRLFGGKER